MKVLVTGASGFLGKAVVERLLVHGFTDIRCNMRRRKKLPILAALDTRFPKATVEYCVGNLKHRDHADRVAEGVQFIFHLAAGKSGAAADLFTDSVIASRNLLDAVSRRRPLRIVLVSSFGVYGTAGLPRGYCVTEDTPLEGHPEWRDHYSHAKLRQEQLFRDYQRQYGFELVILRPGVIYGPGGSHFSSRVGLSIGKWQINLGGRNILPLSYVDNCAEAVVFAGVRSKGIGEVYNVHDENLPTCNQYIRAYKKYVKNVRCISLPYFGLQLLSRVWSKYNEYSKGQLPAVFTPYKVAAAWGGNRFDNRKLRGIGWKQLVSTDEGLQRTFAVFRSETKQSESTNVGTLHEVEDHRSQDLHVAAHAVVSHSEERA